MFKSLLLSLPALLSLLTPFSSPKPAAQAATPTPSSPSVTLAQESKFILGYSRPQDLELHIASPRLAGIFITSRNAAGKNINQLTAEISHFQFLRAQSHLPPLHIVADQEGGVVSHLSPPLPLRPAGSADIPADLASLGVTVNLAPVIDQPRTKINDQSKLYLRALTQSQGDTFLSSLESYSLAGTLKHFPGLGQTTIDTHTKIPTLTLSDTQPFVGLARAHPGSWIMLSHAIVPDIDPGLPLSLSVKSVPFIRSHLGLSNPLITDDLSMPSLDKYPHKLDLAAASGIDYLLITHPPASVLDSL